MAELLPCDPPPCVSAAGRPSLEKGGGQEALPHRLPGCEPGAPVEQAGICDSTRESAAVAPAGGTSVGEGPALAPPLPGSCGAVAASAWIASAWVGVLPPAEPSAESDSESTTTSHPISTSHSISASDPRMASPASSSADGEPAAICCVTAPGSAAPPPLHCVASGSRGTACSCSSAAGECGASSAAGSDAVGIDSSHPSDST
mmetsp:Transcript_499/g.1484  ORF Transcript_499/g.1484 Transcript_499/m.1484 type:complete len:203 (-) Transcript_499:2584-3192(-)